MPLKSLHLIFGALQQACPYLELCFGWDDGGGGGDKDEEEGEEEEEVRGPLALLPGESLTLSVYRKPHF